MRFIVFLLLVSFSLGAFACPQGKVWKVKGGYWGDKSTPKLTEPGYNIFYLGIPLKCDTTKASYVTHGRVGGSSVSLRCVHVDGSRLFQQAWYLPKGKKAGETEDYREVQVTLASPSGAEVTIVVGCFPKDAKY